jgi:hypothetical protein
MTERHFRYYYEGLGDEWEAISVEYDIAVSGRSLDEVKRLLKAAILSYIEDASKEDERARKRLLNRRMPWMVRLGWHLRIIKNRLHLKSRSAAEGRFDLTCPA